LKGVRADAALCLPTGHSQLEAVGFRPSGLTETPVAFTEPGKGIWAIGLHRRRWRCQLLNGHFLSVLILIDSVGFHRTTAESTIPLRATPKVAFEDVAYISK
jgi:hypothetical protein